MNTPFAEGRPVTLATWPRRLKHAVQTLLGAALLTLAFFLVLPLLQAITDRGPGDLVLRSADTVNLPPPPPPPEPEPEKEPEREEEPPKLAEEAPPLDLSQLELALNTGGAGAWVQGDFGVKLNQIGGQDESEDALFSLAELDQRPVASYQPMPPITNEMRRKAPATVHVLFIVDAQGRVDAPRVQESRGVDPIFERAALEAVKKWKFEPGKRNGKPVRFRMRVPITFPKGM